MEYVKIVVSDEAVDKEQVNDRRLRYQYRPGLTVKSLLEDVINQGSMEVEEAVSLVLKDWTNYLIIVDGKNIRHREGLETKIVNGSDIVILIHPLVGG